MKSVFKITMIVTLLAGCTSSRQVLRPPAENMIDLSQNEEEYELMVLDPGFETWFSTSWNSGKDRSADYYSYWNNRYVSEWNYQTTLPHRSQFFTNRIQYDPIVDYGIEIERKLFYYFRWVETKLGIPILSTRPPGGI